MERAISSVWKKRGATKLFRRHGTWGARWASSLPSMMSANETTTPVGFPSYIVWGANTGVGKTLVSAGLAAGAAREGQSFAFIKPVQTGFPKDIDARLVAHAHGKCRILYGDHAAEILDAPESPRVSRVWKTNMKAQDVESRSHSITLFAWREAVSPHVAMEREGMRFEYIPVSVSEFIICIYINVCIVLLYLYIIYASDCQMLQKGIGCLPRDLYLPSFSNAYKRRLEKVSIYRYAVCHAIVVINRSM